MGGDIHRSKVAKIQMILKKHGIKPAEAIFITDTLGDMREAIKCGVLSIGVTWGFHEKERLQKRFHDFLLDGTAIMTLLGSKPGAEFGAQLKGIQEAALGKGDLPFFPDEIRRELERRITVFRHSI